jgi:hypothetical protein
MNRFDQLLLRLQRWTQRQALLYRLTLGTRVLLAVGFIPTGLVKLLGYRFTSMSPETRLGGFFDTMYQSGPYWHFIGLAQVLAGVLVLWSMTATLGALLFFAIIANIFVITLSYDFHGTPIVVGLMLLATLYLLVWDYDRLRGIFGLVSEPMDSAATLPRHQLSGRIERGAYVTGAVAGVGLLTGQRGLFFPWEWNLWFLLTCVVSLLVAAWFGLSAELRRIRFKWPLFRLTRA